MMTTDSEFTLDHLRFPGCTVVTHSAGSATISWSMRLFRQGTMPPTGKTGLRGGAGDYYKGKGWRELILKDAKAIARRNDLLVQSLVLR
jgi:hypothetical protein